MRKFILLIVILMVASCKNADYEVESVAAENTAVEDFDKTVFYEEYIQEKFLEFQEKGRIGNLNPDMRSKMEQLPYPMTFSNHKLKALELDFMKDGINWSPDFDYKINSEYEYHYKATLIYFDSITNKTFNMSELISIDENFRIIDGDSIPTIDIIWKAPFNH